MATLTSAAVRARARLRSPQPAMASWVMAGALLVGTSLGGLAYRTYQNLTPVTLVVDGIERTVRTTETDPTQLLRRMGYHLRPEDALRAPAALDGAARRVEIQRSRPVHLTVGGHTSTVWTRAMSVAELLEAEGVTLQPLDVVLLDGAATTLDGPLPAAVWTGERAGLSPAAANRPPAPLNLQVKRAVKATVVDGSGLPASLVTTAATVAEALAEAEVPIYEGDTVFPALGSRLQPGQRIVIRRSTPLQVTVGGRTLATRSQAATVGDALAEMGVMVAGLDRVTPSLETPLQKPVHVTVTRVREEIVYEESHTPFKVVWAPDDNVPIDTQRVANPGVEGVQRKRFRIRYEDGVEVARVQEDDWMAAEPQDRVIAYGRKVEPLTLDTPEGPMTYWRKVRVYTTSYSPARSGTPRSAPWYGRTRIGLPLAKGIAAVDPALIPLRSKMYVPGYGVALAGDTGGGIKGKFIDLGYDDANYQSWHWWTDIYLLWPPPPSYAIQYILPNYPRFPDRRR